MPDTPPWQPLVSVLSQHGLDGADVCDAMWLWSRSAIPLPTAVHESTQAGPKNTGDEPDLHQKNQGEDELDAITYPKGGDAASLPDSTPDKDTPAPPERQSSPTPSRVPVYPDTDRSEGDLAARRITLPGASTYSRELELMQALRPLRVQRPDSRHLELDEEATVERISQTGIWAPVMRARPSRWLDLTLVVEQAPTMRMWQDAGHKLAHDLQRGCAPRRFSTATAETGSDGTLRIASPSGRRTSPLPGGHVILFSDALSLGWLHGTVPVQLWRWQKSSTVILLQPLPPLLWSRTTLRKQLPIPLHLARQTTPSPLPVVSLDPLHLANLATTLAGRSQRPVAALTGPPGIFRENPPPVVSTIPFDPATLSSDHIEQVRRQFVETASPQARVLANYLASVPEGWLHLPIMQLIQRQLVTDAAPWALAEIFLSGLLYRRHLPSPAFTEEITYDYLPTLRDHFRDKAPLDRQIEIRILISRYFENLWGTHKTFTALCPTENPTDQQRITDDTASIASIPAAQPSVDQRVPDETIPATTETSIPASQVPAQNDAAEDELPGDATQTTEEHQTEDASTYPRYQLVEEWNSRQHTPESHWRVHPSNPPQSFWDKMLPKTSYAVSKTLPFPIDFDFGAIAQTDRASGIEYNIHPTITIIAVDGQSGAQSLVNALLKRFDSQIPSIINEISSLVKRHIHDTKSHTELLASSEHPPQELLELISRELGLKIDWVLRLDPMTMSWIKSLQAVLPKRLVIEFNKESPESEFSLAFSVRVVTVNREKPAIVSKRARLNISVEEEIQNIHSRVTQIASPAFQVLTAGEFEQSPNLIHQLSQDSFNSVVTSRIAQEFGYRVEFRDIRVLPNRLAVERTNQEEAFRLSTFKEQLEQNLRELNALNRRREQCITSGEWEKLDALDEEASRIQEKRMEIQKAFESYSRPSKVASGDSLSSDLREKFLRALDLENATAPPQLQLPEEPAPPPKIACRLISGTLNPFLEFLGPAKSAPPTSPGELILSYDPTVRTVVLHQNRSISQRFSNRNMLFIVRPAALPAHFVFELELADAGQSPVTLTCNFSINRLWYDKGQKLILGLLPETAAVPQGDQDLLAQLVAHVANWVNGYPKLIHETEGTDIIRNHSQSHYENWANDLAAFASDTLGISVSVNISLPYEDPLAAPLELLIDPIELADEIPDRIALGMTLHLQAAPSRWTYSQQPSVPEMEEFIQITTRSWLREHCHLHTFCLDYNSLHRELSEHLHQRLTERFGYHLAFLNLAPQYSFPTQVNLRNTYDSTGHVAPGNHPLLIHHTLAVEVTDIGRLLTHGPRPSPSVLTTQDKSSISLSWNSELEKWVQDVVDRITKRQISGSTYSEVAINFERTTSEIGELLKKELHSIGLRTNQLVSIPDDRQIEQCLSRSFTFYTNEILCQTSENRVNFNLSAQVCFAVKDLTTIQGHLLPGKSLEDEFIQETTHAIAVKVRQLSPQNLYLGFDRPIPPDRENARFEEAPSPERQISSEIEKRLARKFGASDFQISLRSEESVLTQLYDKLQSARDRRCIVEVETDAEKVTFHVYYRVIAIPPHGWPTFQDLCRSVQNNDIDATAREVSEAMDDKITTECSIKLRGLPSRLAVDTSLEIRQILLNSSAGNLIDEIITNFGLTVEFTRVERAPSDSESDFVTFAKGKSGALHREYFLITERISDLTLKQGKDHPALDDLRKHQHIVEEEFRNTVDSEETLATFVKDKTDSLLREFRLVSDEISHLTQQHGSDHPHLHDLQDLRNRLEEQIRDTAALKDYSRIPVDRAHPGLVIILVDQSSSMSERYTSIHSRAQFVSMAVNRCIYDILAKCRVDTVIRDLCHIVVVGYGASPQKLLIAGRPSDLADKVLRIDDVKQLVPDRSGGLVEVDIKLPLWLEPVASGSTPMAEAFTMVTELVRSWTSENPQSFPPVCLNITDGVPDDEAAAENAARLLMETGTSDGNTLLFNAHIGDATDGEVKMPASDGHLNNPYARFLFRISSPIPPPIDACARRVGLQVRRDSRGMIMNAGPETLTGLIRVSRSHITG